MCGKLFVDAFLYEVDSKVLIIYVEVYGNVMLYEQGVAVFGDDFV